jgi:hypothetical protein
MATTAATTNRVSSRSPANSQPERPEKKSPPRRTTVALSLRAKEIVERFRSASGTSTSAAIDQIIQRSEPKPSRLKEVNGFLVLDLPAKHDAVHFTLEDVKQAEDEMDREYMERFMRLKNKSVSKGSSTGSRP